MIHRFRILALTIALLAAGSVAGQARAESPYEAAIQYALEKLVSGIHTESFFGGTEVSVTPIRTWKSVSGHYCREYKITVDMADTGEQSDRQIRCREDGYWKLVPKT
ncbi:MAG: hypothetical protein OEN23_17060 [Paracoccaceae bacterium]|nr:hypothetical protein [Paracoccaceae bacterium]